MLLLIPAAVIVGKRAKRINGIRDSGIRIPDA
jgi:hypothetical protein